MKIKVDDIRDKARNLAFDEPAGDFPSLKELQAAGDCAFQAPLSVDLTVYREFDHIRVKGTVATRIRLSCSRCLADYESDLHSAFSLFFTPAGQTSPDEEEVELAEVDLVSISYSGNEIDLAPEIAEQVIMEMPLKPLCTEGCRGLCSRCGADLNVGECGCERGDINLKFSSLKDFKAEQ